MANIKTTVGISILAISTISMTSITTGHTPDVSYQLTQRKKTSFRILNATTLMASVVGGQKLSTQSRSMYIAEIKVSLSLHRGEEHSN